MVAKIGNILTISHSNPFSCWQTIFWIPWNWGFIVGSKVTQQHLPDSEHGDLSIRFSQTFLTKLQQIDANNGPLAGGQSFYRGADLHIYDNETRQAIEH